MASRLEQAFLAWLGDAAKAFDEGVGIEVTARVEGDRLLVQYGDTLYEVQARVATSRG